MSSIDIPVDAVLCNDPMCDISPHTSKIQVFYKSIIAALIKACDQSALSIHSSAVINNVKSIPGWNLAIKPHHANAKKAFLKWRNFGRSDNAQLFFK